MPKRVFKGLINNETFKVDMQQFAQERYIYNSDLSRQQFIIDVLKHHEESPFIDWREVSIYSEGYFSGKANFS